MSSKKDQIALQQIDFSTRIREIEVRENKAATDFGTMKITWSDMQNEFDACEIEREKLFLENVQFIAENGIFKPARFFENGNQTN